MAIEEKLIAPEEITVLYRRRGVRRVLHSLLPESAYARLRGLRLKFEASSLGRRCHLAVAAMLETLSRSGIASAVFYTIFSREFDREHRAILASRASHIRDIYSGRGNLYMLRRNVHRIEKGLIMKPPRPIFALGMIQETVRAFASYPSHIQGCQPYESDELVSFRWSAQVLGEYFGRVKNHPVVDEARKIFDETVRRHASLLANDQPRAPFVREIEGRLPTIEMMEALAAYRRSARWFADRPVPRDVIDRAVSVAAYSPTACNRQPFRFAIYDTPELVKKVGAIPKGTPGWLHQIPCFVVIVGKFDAFRFERDRHIPYIDGCLAAMSLIYALEVQGVSSCCVNFPDYADTEARMARTLGLPPSERAIMCLAVGYPDKAERVPYSQKLPLTALRQYNFVTNSARV